MDHLACTNETNSEPPSTTTVQRAGCANGPHRTPLDTTTTMISTSQSARTVWYTLAAAVWLLTLSSLKAADSELGCDGLNYFPGRQLGSPASISAGFERQFALLPRLSILAGIRYGGRLGKGGGMQTSRKQPDEGCACVKVQEASSCSCAALLHSLAA